MTQSIFQVAVFVAVMCQVSESFTGDLNKPEDCQSLLTAGITKSGEYTIWINGITPTVVYCDMVSEGGGWTVFQRRMDGSVNFYKTWDEYKRGFGNISGEFWLGLDAIHELTKNGDISLRVDMTAVTGTKYYERYLKFNIGSESINYKLYVSGHSGTAGDELGYHNRRPFSTKDRDNDAWSGHCAVQHKGAWWYGACVHAELNSLYKKIASWPYIYWRGLSAITFTEMKIRGKKNCETLALEGNRINKEYITWLNGLAPIPLYCDMTTDNGGWTVIQRRVDQTLNFDRTWNVYKTLFGSRTGSFWEGLNMIRTLTQNGAVLRIELKDLNGKRWYAKYRRFKVGAADDYYRLEISGYTGNAGDSMTYHNGMPFSTKDADHDPWAFNCAVEYNGGWWYKDCMEASLNAKFKAGPVGHIGDASWLKNLGYGNLSFTEMKVRNNYTLHRIPAVTSPPTSKYSTSNHVTQTIQSVVPHTTAKTNPGLSDMCKNYRILSDDARFHAFNNTGKASCDNNLSGWYRFMYNAGNEMLDSCPASQHVSAFQCGGNWQGWLHGTRPEETQLEVNRTVCFSTNNSCNCDFKKTIKVINCGGYYLYLLNGVPACNQRYCGAKDKRAFVSCTENYIHVELNKKYFNASKYASITLRNESCKAVVSNNRITLGSTPLGCGTTMINTGDEIIYKNQVILKAKVSESEMISRDRDQKITIRCAYNARGDVGGLIYPIRMREEIIDGFGKITFSLAMYQSNAYGNSYRAYPVKVNIRDRLYFQASAVVQDPRLLLFIDRCYSTPNMNRTHYKKYVIIENGCPKDSTVQFHKGSSHSQRFSFEAFRYIGESTPTVFIHCKLFLCDKLSQHGKCHIDCPGSNVHRMKRDASAQVGNEMAKYTESYLLEAGPISRKDENADLDKQDASSGKPSGNKVIIALAAGVAALAIVVLALLLRRRKAINNPHLRLAEVGIDNGAIGKSYGKDNIAMKEFNW